MQLLSAAYLAACAIGSPIKPVDIIETDVESAIHRIRTELIDRFDEKIGWEPEADHTNWLSKGLGGSTAVATQAPCFLCCFPPYSLPAILGHTQRGTQTRQAVPETP